MHKAINPAPVPHNFSDAALSLCYVRCDGCSDMLLGREPTSHDLYLPPCSIHVGQEDQGWLLHEHHGCIFQHLCHQPRLRSCRHCATNAYLVVTSDANIKKGSCLDDLWDGCRVSDILYTDEVVI